MNKQRIIIAAITGALFATVTLPLQSQIYIGDPFNEQQLKMRVKQLDEFVSRFNYEKDIDGITVKNRQDTAKRKLYIASLFNKDLVTNVKETVLEVYYEFIETVVNPSKPVYLHFADTNWTAEAICKAVFKGKPVRISLFLKTEKINDNEYKWVINSVQGEIFDLKPDKKNPGLMISPVDNELGFMSLADISGKAGKNIINYSYKNYSVDNLSVFNTLIYTGLLNIEYVQKVVYYFYQAPDFIFTVEHFEREDSNAGWLISSIIKTKKNEKHE